MKGQRGIALITVLLAVVVLTIVVAVMIDLGTVQLRRTLEETRSLQAQAGADAGFGWVRGLLDKNRGDIGVTLADLAKASSTYSYPVDADAYVSVHVTIELANPSSHYDHLDSALEKNLQVDELPLQVVCAATVSAGTDVVAHRTSTALLRVFHNAAPYSEIVGVIDNAGPVGIASPGDPAGQAAGTDATDLRIHAYVQSSGTAPRPADNYQNAQWSDGNPDSSGGPLP